MVDPKVKIDSHEIGGPSAGLMFTLEIYNQLVDEDLTRGHEIAGTGTINEKGEIGPIGGIQQKWSLQVMLVLKCSLRQMKKVRRNRIIKMHLRLRRILKRK